MGIQVALCALLLLNTAALGAAQSLAELARKERARREMAGPPSRVIRNKDLKTIVGAKMTRVHPSPPATEKETAADVPARTAEDAGASETPHNEKYWRDAFTEARLQLKLVQDRELVLQLKGNELRNRFFIESDGSTRSLIEQQINQTLQEIESNKEEIARAEEALRRLEAAAKKENVPAAWMRAEIPE
ncbi:MAG: hypothetical protein HYX74_01555 [Acidobacteria bacterium]|nr:hypothetical protein [Acidobacteriota bacterium]